MRIATEPNRRVQDGIKAHLLCDTCEQLFSAWEKAFADQVFEPFHATGVGEARVRYQHWALKFASSVSWRVLLFLRDQGLEGHLTQSDRSCVEQAASVWADFLLGRRDHPGEFEQHILHVDAPEEISGPPPSPYLNRYLLRAWDLDVIASRSMVMTYAKLGRVMVFGFVRVQSPRRWQGTKIHVRDGFLPGVNCVIPGLLARYWNDRAELMSDSMQQLSKAQRARIDDVFASTSTDVLAKSEAFRAMAADVRFSGRAAFHVNEETAGDSDEP